MEGKGDDDDDVAEVLAPSAAITARVLSSFAHRDLEVPHTLTDNAAVLTP